MAVNSYDLVVVQGDQVTVDLLVWRRYKVRAAGIVEKLLDANPHLAMLHRVSPFLPLNTHVRIPIDPEILRGSPKPAETLTVFGHVTSRDLPTR